MTFLHSFNRRIFRDGFFTFNTFDGLFSSMFIKIIIAYVKLMIIQLNFIVFIAFFWIIKILFGAYTSRCVSYSGVVIHFPRWYTLSVEGSTGDCSLGQPLVVAPYSFTPGVIPRAELNQIMTNRFSLILHSRYTSNVIPLIF